MNWNRVLTGALWAATVIFAGDIIYLVLETQLSQSPGPAVYWNILGRLSSHVIADFAIGLALSWLYASIRPRMSPGPRTAAIIGSVGFVLAYQNLLDAPHGVWQGFSIFWVKALVGWLAFVSAVMLAGWQYRELPPS
jgi:hypothetical protein